MAGLSYLNEIKLSYKQEYALDESMTVDNSVIYSYMYLTSTMTCYQPCVDTPCTELHSNLNADVGSIKRKHLCYLYFPVDIASLFSMWDFKTERRLLPLHFQCFPFTQVITVVEILVNLKITRCRSVSEITEFLLAISYDVLIETPCTSLWLFLFRLVYIWMQFYMYFYF